MTDRELLELAAKAAGVNGQWSDYHNGICYSKKGSLDMHVWRPLDDDGDALRLAVQLRLVVHVWDDAESVSVAKTLPDGKEPSPTSVDWHWADAHACGGIEAATRRAIVRAAAEKALTASAEGVEL